ncbi:hypothetical protein ACEPAI_7982 [Sanghuangporus weigelae]
MDEAVKRLKEATLTTMAVSISLRRSTATRTPLLKQERSKPSRSHHLKAVLSAIDKSSRKRRLIAGGEQNNCGKTFWTRSEWKGHISCISEAEKYQKALYKGKKTQKNGPTPLGADKSESSGKEGPNKKSGNGVESIRRDTSDTVVNNGNHATTMAVPAADAQAKEASKKKKRKADGSHLAPTGDASSSDSKKKRKKQKLDAADTNRQTETAQDYASKTAVSSPTDMAPQVSETKTLEKEKKDRKDKKRWKEKKDKEKPVSDVGKEGPIAPSATDPQPSASNDRQESDNPPKKFKKKDAKSNSSEKVSEESVPVPTDEAGTQAAVKKKKKSKGEHKDSTALNVKRADGAAPEHTTPDEKRKQPDETGDDDALLAKKAKKERGKERKRKARNDAQPVENP